MKNLRIIIFIGITALATAVGTVRADEVILKNGDRLTGTIVKMSEGTLVLKTSYAGEVKIDWKEVQGFSSEAPTKVRTLDGSNLMGVVTSPSPDNIVITGDQLETPIAIPLTSIQTINPPPPVRHSGTFNLGGIIAKGNSDSKAINASLLYSLRTDRHRFGVEGKYNYGEQSKKISVRNSLAQLTYDFFLTKRAFWNTFALFEQDTLQDLILRSTYGTGPGYQFIDTERTKLSGTVGVAYVNEDWRTREDTHSTAGRWGVNFRTALIPDRLIFFHRQEGFYDFKEPNAWRLRADQGLQVPVYKQFAVNLEYDVRFNSNPAPGRKRTDHLYIVGLSYICLSEGSARRATGFRAGQTPFSLHPPTPRLPRQPLFPRAPAHPEAALHPPALESAETDSLALGQPLFPRAPAHPEAALHPPALESAETDSLALGQPLFPRAPARPGMRITPTQSPASPRRGPCPWTHPFSPGQKATHKPGHTAV